MVRQVAVPAGHLAAREPEPVPGSMPGVVHGLLSGPEVLPSFLTRSIPKLPAASSSSPGDGLDVMKAGS